MADGEEAGKDGSGAEGLVEQRNLSRMGLRVQPPNHERPGGVEGGIVEAARRVLPRTGVEEEPRRRNRLVCQAELRSRLLGLTRSHRRTE